MDKIVSQGKSYAIPRVFKEPPPPSKASADAYFASEDYREFIFDASSGAGVTSFGHSCLIIKQAMINQIREMPYAHSGQWASSVVEHAARSIIEQCGPRFEQGGVTFYSGGSEAMEAALKFAVQMLSGEQQRTPVLSRKHSYHGNTLGSLAISDHPRSAFLDRMHIMNYDDDRHFDAFAPSLFATELNADELKAYTDSALNSLRDMLIRSRVVMEARAIVVIETIGGTTLGIEPPTSAYLEGVRRLCDKYGAVLIHDEVLSGNFRTGYLLASAHYGLEWDIGIDVSPDIAVLGKGITGGYFPMSAVVLSSDARSAIDECGSMAHTSTNQNHPIGCAAVSAAMSRYGDILPKIRSLAGQLVQEIVPQIRRFDHVHSVNGVGCLWGIRFDPNKQGLHREVKRQLFAKGIACYTDGDMAEGKGNMLLFAPPYNTGLDDLEMFTNAIGSLEL